MIGVGEYLQSSLKHDGGEGVWQGWLGASVGARGLKKDASESGKNILHSTIGATCLTFSNGGA